MTMASSASGEPSRLTSAQRAVLHAAHECGALMFGSFTLKNGRTSPFFFDVGKFRDGRCMHLLAEAYAACIYESRLQYDLIFGPAYKGIPLATCTALMLASRYGQQAPFVYDRKEEKDHGVGKIRSLAPEAQLVALVVLLDREEKKQGTEVGAAEAVAEEFGTRVLPILKMGDLLLFLDELLESERDADRKAELNKNKQDMLEYRQLYGINHKPQPSSNIDS